MLTPEQIAALGDAAAGVAVPIEEFLIQDIARRIAGAGQLTSTAAYQIYRAQQLGLSRRQIRNMLRKELGVSHRELRKLLWQSAEVGYNFDIRHLPRDAVPFAENAAVQQMVAAAVKLAKKDFTNITQTLGMIAPDGKAYPMGKAYQKTMDYAFQQVFTGAADYNTAIRTACRNIADQGVRVIDYESGVHTGLEAAVRRNIMGGMGLMQEQISQRNHDQFGADGWEISAHGGSAPDHEPIQGRQYSDKEYARLNGSLKRRIGTLNCGHAAFPIILGVNEPQYTPEHLAELQRQNAQGIDYQGRHYTQYDVSQKQRQIERTMRKQKSRVLVAESTGDKDALTVSQIRLGRLNEEYVRFSKVTGQRTQRERAFVAGFGKGGAARASGAYRKALQNQSNDGIIKDIKHDGEVRDVQKVCKLDMEKYKCVTPDIVSDEVVITAKQIEHIQAGHPLDYERYIDLIPQMIDNPDYIIEANKPHTAVILKRFLEHEKNFQLVMRIRTSNDPEHYMNSIITFMKIKDREWARLLKNKKILYKSE